MAGRRLPRVWPRRLRWRLVLGFALTVALLQAALLGAERSILEQELVASIRQNMEATVHAALYSEQAQGPAGGPALPDVSKQPRAWPLGGKKATTWLNTLEVNAALLKRSYGLLQSALDTTNRLPLLAKAMALPDQPVALLDAQGFVLPSYAIELAKDRTRARKLAPAVLKSLVLPARPRVHKLATAVLKSLAQPAGARAAGLTPEWAGQVATPDGPYLVLLWPTTLRVLTPTQMRQAELALKMGPKALFDPTMRALLQDPPGAPLVVLIAHRLGDVEATVQTVTAISLGGSLAVIGLASLLGLLVVGRALRPLALITRGAERLARGDYQHRLALAAGGDEVGRLAAAFDTMAAAIGAAFATQRRFVADASHELRTPLTALRGYTDVLQMGVGDDPATASRVLQAMQEDLGRMSRLVDDLLSLARLDGGAALRSGPVVAADLLALAAEEGRLLAQGRQTIVVEVVAPELVLWADRDRLRQVLSNLIGNACAYCPRGSVISLSAPR